MSNTAFINIFLLILASTTIKGQYKIKEKQAITFMEDGGWCWYEDPRAIIHNEKLIIGVISGISGDIRVGVYDLKSEKLLGVSILDKGFEIDDHNSPVFYARPDGSILAVWAMHGKENKHYYSISDTQDYTKWGERKEYIHGFELPKGYKWGGVTYMNLYTIENQKLLYNFFRNGPTINPTLITSKDNGETWSKESLHFIMDEVEGTNRPYARYTQVSPNMIGISFTDAHPRNYGNSIYYVNYDGTSFYKADGTKIKDLSDGSLKTSETDKIYTGSETRNKPEGYGSVTHAAWTCDLETDKKERPYLGYTLYRDTTDIRFRLANWTGKKWNDREIAFAGKGLYKREDSYSGLIALDPEDPNKVFISTSVNPNTGIDKGGKHEIFMAKIKDTDNTETIEWTQLTFNSKHKNIRPIVIAGEGYKVVLWLGNKPWRHFQDYESDIVGYVLEKPKK